MGTDEKMLEAVLNAKKQAKSAERDYDFAAEMIAIKSERNIDLFGGTAVSQVADIAADSRKACDELYASYQMLVRLLDEQCKPLLNEKTDAYAIREVAEMIKWLNSESEIGANFSGTLNGSALGSLVDVKYFPSIENKMIEKYWLAKAEAHPEHKVAEQKYRENQRKEREAEIAEKRAARERERLEREQEREAERKARQEEKHRRIEKENSLKDILFEVRPKFQIAANWISLGKSHAAVIKDDGTVVAVGKNDKGQCNVSGWTDIVQIVCEDDTTYGLTKNGYVYVTGDGFRGQTRARNWKNIKQIAAGGELLLGIDAIGKVYSTAGGPTPNDTVESVMCWTDVDKIYGNDGNVVAVKKDGSCLSASYNYYGRSDRSFGGGISHIKQPIDVSVGRTSEGFICRDGSVDAIGGIGGNTCISADNIAKTGGIAKIYMHGNRPIGITYDKKVVVGKNGDEYRTDSGYNGITNFVKTINGHVVACASNGLAIIFLTDKGQVYYYERSHSYGSVFENGLIFDQDFRAYDDFEVQVDRILNEKKYEEEKRRQKEKLARGWREQGLCQYCGGTFKKGIFAVKCKNCGHKLDYQEEKEK